MNIIQLDEECDAKHLAEACADEGKVQAWRFPRNLKGAPDSEVFDVLLPKQNPILTLDQGFARDHSKYIPELHPGILVLGYDDNSVRNMSTHAAQNMLARLKTEIPGWDDLDMSNSIVTVKESTIEISRCESFEITVDEFLRREIPGWQESLLRRLASNSAVGNLE